MKYFNFRQLGSVVILIGALACYAIVNAHEGHEDAAPAKAQEASAKEAPIRIPATTEAIWKAVDQKNAELGSLIQSGSLGDVHHVAFAIRDLVAALPEHAKSLSADRQVKLQGGVKFVATLAERLDASGDANDKAGVQANYEKLQKLLEGLRSDDSAKTGS